MRPTKATVVAHLEQLLAERLSASKEAITTTRASFAGDTKSSAGDKHEVGRAMVQQELDKLEAQRAHLLALQGELGRVPKDGSFMRVAFGSLVTTDQGMYFIAIGLGPVQVDGHTCYAISLASPIGQLLHGKAAGDAVSFNGRRIVLQPEAGVSLYTANGNAVMLTFNYYWGFETKDLDAQSFLAVGLAYAFGD
ncbi:MAG: 3-oxoacyl-ACP synthase [Bacteroidetes bacterium]|nr:3-oxoacyl-ACP synthase [Bacteroidota bacterium]